MAKAAVFLGLKFTIKKTIFQQFCGGENIEECNVAIQNLAQSGIGTILDYSVEGEESEETFDATCEEVLKTIARAKGNGDIPFSVFKTTGIMSSDVLEAASSVIEVNQIVDISLIENLLSERQNGFKIAVNILNIGRIKLAAAVVGASKGVISTAVNYANERKQFGTSISSFGAIKHKIGDMIAKVFASESACYRAGQNIDDAIDTLLASGMESGQAKLKGVEQFAIECAMLKVHGSEVLDYVVDEGVQIYGGMGFSAEAPMDRAYRDSRINRIFEGTNEINRLLSVGTIVKRAMKGELNLMPAAMAVGKEILSIPDFGAEEEDGLFIPEKKALKNMKKAILMIAGASLQKFMMKFEEEQEIIMNLADMLIETYVAESALLRVEKLITLRGEEACALEKDAALVYLHTAIDKLNSAGKVAITSFAEGDELRVMLMGLKRFTKIEPINLKDARRKLADAAIQKNGYIFI